MNKMDNLKILNMLYENNYLNEEGIKHYVQELKIKIIENNKGEE